MNAKPLLLAAVTGFAGFMLATVAVTELLQPRIEFSVLVGLPVGVLVGLLTTWFVYTRQSRATTDGGQRVSSALIAAGVAFVLFMALVTTFGGGVTFALLGGVLVSVVSGLVMYVKGPETF